MAVSPKNYSVAVGEDWKQYAAGAVNCVADSPNGRQCARRVVLLATGDLSPCVNSEGVARNLTGLPAGFVHDASVQSFTCSAAVIVYW